MQFVMWSNCEIVHLSKILKMFSRNETTKIHKSIQTKTLCIVQGKLTLIEGEQHIQKNNQNIDPKRKKYILKRATFNNSQTDNFRNKL